MDEDNFNIEDFVNERDSYGEYDLDTELFPDDEY